MAYFGLFRVGELTSSPHSVRANDVHIGINMKKILFILRSSKTHTLGSLPQKIKISSTDQVSATVHYLKKEKSMFCPYTVLRNYLSVRP